MTTSFYKDIYNFLSKRHPNRKIHAISDHHFFHVNIILYGRPKFSNISEMNEYIIKCHNDIVGPDDVVIFLGDFCFKNGAIKALLSQMNGHKYLLLGNHDKPKIFKQYGELGFEGVFTTPIKIHSNYLSHQPLDNSVDDPHFKLLVKEFNSNPNGINYHGHIHTTEESTKPYYNVTCEALEYKPLLIGYTGGILTENDSPLIIDSERFEHILEFINNEKNISPSIILSDYIYSIMLEANSAYSGSCFVYGSFPLYKRFGYISNFSDLDVALIFDGSISKKRNARLLKETADRMYASILDIDGINVSFIKRFINMCSFEAMFASKTGYYVNCMLDANSIPHNLYRDSDFINVHDATSIEKLLEKDCPELLEGIYLPHYQVQYLSTNGYIANLLLQTIFQKGYDDKKHSALKKLKYIFKNFGTNNNSNICTLEDTIIRFFLRNILFFHTVNRSSEIDYIRYAKHDVDTILKSLPVSLSLPLESILKDPNSQFNLVFRELMLSNFDDIPEIVSQLSPIK